MAKNGTLIYQGFFKDTPEGAIYLQQANGCKLIANVTPAASTSQKEFNEDMKLIVDWLNHSKVGVQLEGGSHHAPKLR